MVHDGTANSCDRAEGYVMSPILGEGGVRNRYQWSTCSAEELRTFRLSSKTTCLHDGGPTALTPSFNLGVTNDLDRQCEVAVGLGSTASRCQTLNVVSTWLFIIY